MLDKVTFKDLFQLKPFYGSMKKVLIFFFISWMGISRLFVFYHIQLGEQYHLLHQALTGFKLASVEFGWGFECVDFF